MRCEDCGNLILVPVMRCFNCLHGLACAIREAEPTVCLCYDYESLSEARDTVEETTRRPENNG